MRIEEEVRPMARCSSRLLPVSAMLTAATRWIPDYCVLCNGARQIRTGLCRGCEAELPWLKHASPCCGLPLPGPQTEAVASAPGPCPACRKSPRAFDDCHSFFYYRNPIKELISRFKYNHSFAEGRMLAGLLVRRFRDSYFRDFHKGSSAPSNPPQVIVPVPLHRDRLRTRGFNQAVEVARPLAAALGIPLDLHSFVRERSTAPQRGLHARERANNITGAFRSSGTNRGADAAPIPFKRVAIVDDVVTTTATANELARVLLQNGAESISVWCIARA